MADNDQPTANQFTNPFSPGSPATSQQVYGQQSVNPEPADPQPARPINPANQPNQNQANPPEQPPNATAWADQFQPPPSEEIILEWQAPNRPYKKRNRRYYTTVITIVFLISLILFFAGQFLPIAVVVSVGFLSYVLAAVPPSVIRFQITTYGLRIENQLHFWEELGRFWFESKFGQKMVHVETVQFPNRITLMLGELQEEDLRIILKEVLLEQKPSPSALERAADWLQEKIPLDIE